MSGGWAGSDRKARLPANWPALRREGLRRNPKRICHWCGLPGGEDFDHKKAGDDHSQDNLDWIHGRRSVERGVSERNCHGEKSSAEGLAARAKTSNRRPKERHPGLL
ncbi:HNH endonuclease [Micromonospora sp. NPDC000207]|uniref:HNH endonuclease n=1 Tax=Micromonospora sp. NPDC000207 TaxID=3154246 RepID=UPI0033344117